MIQCACLWLSRSPVKTVFQTAHSYKFKSEEISSSAKEQLLFQPSCCDSGISSSQTPITFLSPHPLRKQNLESTNMAIYPVAPPTGESSLQNTFWPGSISVLNDLPTVCTLFLHPLSLFHPLISGRNFTLGLSLSPWHYSVIPLSPYDTTIWKKKTQADKVNPLGKPPNIQPNTQTWRVIAASPMQLCWPWTCELKKVYDKKILPS